VLGGERGGGGHDWLVVTLLVVPVAALDPVEALLEAPAAVLLVVLVAVVLVGVVLAGADATVVVRLEASAGSCPVTSASAIISHTATNAASAPATTRRRRLRARTRRDRRIAVARARADSVGFGSGAGAPA
jgi:hypothetical protein